MIQGTETCAYCSKIFAVECNEAYSNDEISYYCDCGKYNTYIYWKIGWVWNENKTKLHTKVIGRYEKPAYRFSLDVPGYLL